MRILQVVHAFMPESMGGTEVQTYRISRALQARGHEVAVLYRVADVAHPENDMLPGDYGGLPVCRLVNNFTWTHHPDYQHYNPGSDAAFSSLLDRFRPDIVHFQHLGGGLSTSWVGLLQRRGLPMILTLHDYWGMCYRSNLLTPDGNLCNGPDGGIRCGSCWEADARQSTMCIRERLRELGVLEGLRRAPRFLLNALVGTRYLVEPSALSYHTTRLMARDAYFRALFARFPVLLSPSQFLRRKYVSWGVAPERIEVLPNVIAAEYMDAIPWQLPLGDRLEVAYIGTLSQIKGLSVLIRAFNALVDEPISLSIYGRTTGSVALERYVDELKGQCRSPQVCFAGPFANEDIGDVLGRTDLVVVPSTWYENSPLTILEALYAGRPVVASNIGGMAELVQDGVNGLTFAAGNSADLAAKLRSLAREPEMVRKLQGGITRPPTAADIVPKLEEWYRAVIGRSAP